MTDREVLEIVSNALHRYMFALTARTQRLAHIEAEKAMEMARKQLLRAGPDTPMKG